MPVTIAFGVVNKWGKEQDDGCGGAMHINIPQNNREGCVTNPRDRYSNVLSRTIQQIKPQAETIQ